MRRSLAVASLVTVAVAGVATAAQAHQGNPNFRSEPDGIRPGQPGLSVRVLNFDDSLELTNSSGKGVVVEGYAGEPYVRIDGSGVVSVNTRSPAYYLNDDRYARIALPARADPRAAPAWRRVSQTGTYIWHDHRIHYMASGIPPQVADTGQRTRVFDYRVPILVGGRPAAITGTLYWVGQSSGFPLGPFVGLGAAALVAALGATLLRRRGDAGISVVAGPALLGLGLCVCAPLLLGCGAAVRESALNGITLKPLPRVGAAALPDYGGGGRGRIERLRPWPGGLRLIYFGYTSCPDVCPATLADLRRAVADLPAADRRRISVGMVTVDPRRDSGRVLRDYVQNFFPPARSHAFRTERMARLRRVERLFGAAHRYGKADAHGDYPVEHTAQVYAVAANGSILVQWPFGTPAAQITADLRELLTRDTTERKGNEE
ncbi:MAG: SCO family protein [Solirubrobacterales bacterium]